MRTQTVGGPRLLDRLLLIFLALPCFSAENGHVFQNIVDCEYTREDLSDMVYMVKLVFNQKLLCDYDSQRGVYVGYDDYGIKCAEKFNNQSWKMAARKAELETLCKANARYFVNTTAREVPPVVTVSFNEKSHYGQLTLLECHMYDFYPKDIEVTWLRDERVVTEGVLYSETMANGDWTYQFHSYLELELQQGEKVSCQVEHSSLKEPLVVLWDSSSLDNKIRKLAVGITSLILGPAVAVTGGLYHYWRTQGNFVLVPLR
ncbi:hypothetical protein NFI96_018104 [Prochilodus magdalenae]|nr:hypothetical protein NFI96_018104 [Prochilodus magdalenae]